MTQQQRIGKVKRAEYSASYYNKTEAHLVEPGRENGLTAAIMGSLSGDAPLYMRIPSARAALQPSSFWPFISERGPFRGSARAVFSGTAGH